MTNPFVAPPPSETAAFFDDWSDSWSDCYTSHRHFRTRLRTLRDYIEGKPRGLSVLDYGCGTGIASLELARHGDTVVGVDISAGMIERSEAMLRRANIPANRYRFEHIGVDGSGAYLSETFDGIVSLGVLEYIEDVRGTLRLVLARLRPGGFFIMSGPNARSPLRGIERFVHEHPGIFRAAFWSAKRSSNSNYLEHQKHQFRQSELVALLGSCGVSLRRIRYHGSPAVLGAFEHSPWLGMTMIAEFQKAPD
jgi:2-polyprenyl-3-methyl-5-hydroxy-6-metoxy-1,4-benzoquinol methylase